MSGNVGGTTTPRRSSGMGTNLILAAVLIVLSSVAYWYEFTHKTKSEKAKEASSKLITSDQEREIEWFQIAYKEKGAGVAVRCVEHCKLTDPNSTWELTEPVKFKADETNGQAFVNSVAGATVSDSIPLEGDVEARLKDYGLSKDKREERKIVIKYKADPQPYTIYVGDNTAIGENMYVYSTGPGQKADTVKLVPAFLKTNMERKPTYWRAKRLFDFASSEVEAFTMKNLNGEVRLVKEEGNWFIIGSGGSGSSGGKAMADNEAVDTFLTALVFLNAQDYVSDDIAKDRAKLQIPAKKNYELQLKVAKKPDVAVTGYDFIDKEKHPKLYVMITGKNFVAELDRTAAEKFQKKTESFRFRQLITAAEKQELGKVALSLSAGGKFEFTSEKDAWKLALGKIDSFDPATVDQALVKLGAARIAEFMGKAALPRGNFELSSWSLFDKAGKLLRTVKIFGTGPKGNFYAKLPSGELVRLEQGSGSAIPSRLVDFAKGAEPAAPPVTEPAAPPAHDGHSHSHSH